MAFNPKDLLVIVHHLNELDDKEETIRSMVNRAYYAAFGVAKVKTKINSTEKVHGKVIKRLKDSNNSNVRNAGGSLETLFVLRCAVDYTYTGPFNSNRFSNVINTAEEIINKLEAADDEAFNCNY